VRSGFLERTSEGGVATVVFHHALVQDAAYSRLLRRRQRELHLRVAEVAEDLYGAGDHVIDLLARHLYLGEAGQKAVAYLVRAGERARKLFANDEAILHLQRAAELAPDDDEIRLGLADLQELVGNYDKALDAYEAVRSTAVGDVRAWRGLAATYRKRGEYLNAFMTVNEAFETEQLRGKDLAPLWLEAGWSLSVSGRVDQAIEVLEAGLETAREETPVIGHIMLQLARAETMQGRSFEALERELEARRIFENADDVHGLTTTMRLLGDTYRTRGELDEAAAALRTGLELAERTGSVEEIGNSLGNLALVELERRNFAEAVACNLRAIEEFERIGHAAGRAQIYANLAWTLLHAGENQEALGYAERAIEAAQAIGHQLATADATDTIARIALTEGRLQDAGNHAEEAADQYVQAGAAPQAAESLELAAQAWEQTDDEERARALRERARSLSST